MHLSRAITNEILRVQWVGNEPRPAVRHKWFLLYWLLSLIPFWDALKNLVMLSLEDERYSHLILIPLISLCLMFWERKRIFREPEYGLRAGLSLLALATIFYLGAKTLPPSLSHSGAIFGIALAWAAGFVLCYGTGPLRAAAFPVCFLLLMIPIPVSIVDKITYALQNGSADTTYVLFRLLGVPVFRHGLTFELPSVAIEVAKECSGIRSSNALFITGLLAGYLFLRSGWRRLWLCLLTIPIAIFKNAVRIATLSWLAIYVDRDFLYGDLHHHGGLPFSILALAILMPMLLLLKKFDKGDA